MRPCPRRVERLRYHDTADLAKDTYRYLLRMPQALRERVSEAAASAGRSFNAEVLHRLAVSFEAESGRRTPNEGSFMSSRRLRVAVLTAAALCAIGAALVVAFATSSSSSARPVSKFASGDPDGSALTKFGNGNELLGVDDYRMSVRAYPASDVPPSWVKNASDTFSRIAARTQKSKTPPNPGSFGVWQDYGPQRLAIEPGVLNFFGAVDHTASRMSALAISSTCTATNCRMWAGPVGGGIWRTDNAMANDPTWTYLTSPFAQNSIGAITLTPSGVLYVGTGEENSCSSGCEAGVGIYRSTDGGDTWTKLADSCVDNATYTCTTPGTDAFLGRGISAVVIDPTNPNHLIVGSATAARSISHVIGLGGQPSRPGDPGANVPGLYESADGGATFTPVWLPNFPWTPLTPAAGRRGVIDVGLDPISPGIVYASAFSDGVWRRCPTGANTTCGGETAAGATDFKQVFAPRDPFAGGTDDERTMFDTTVINGHTRVYLTTGQVGASPGGGESASSFWRLDNANQTSTVLLASEPAVPAPTPGPLSTGLPYPQTYSGWTILSSSSLSSPYWATDNFCTGQCWYDQDVFTPKAPFRPDDVYVIGSYSYGDLPCYTRGVGCGNEIDDGKAVLYSTTAGDPDPSQNNRTFTDMTADGHNHAGDWCAYEPFGFPCAFAFGSIHPDQHAIVVNPSIGNQFIEGSDGGIVRNNGDAGNPASFYIDGSPLCFFRAIGGSAFTQCQRLLSRIPTELQKLNTGISNTLQFIGVAANPSNPCQVLAGTQDNGTWESSSACPWDPNDFNQVIYGDGGNAGYDAYPDQSSAANGKRWMFNEFTSGFSDSSFESGTPDQWVITSAPIARSGEAIGFYWPQIADPNPPFFGGERTHPIFSGAKHVWRTWAFGAGRPTSVPQQVNPDISYFENNCQEFFVSGLSATCGDYQPLGGPAGSNTAGDLTGTVYGADRTGGAISWIARRGADNNTMWATTSAGRVFVTYNANASDPAAVVWYRVDSLATAAWSGNCPLNPPTANPTPPPGGSVNCSPTRHPNGIYPDPSDPNAAFIAYSGYNAATAGTPGHVFRVSVTTSVGVPVNATFGNLNVENGGTNTNPTPTATGDLPANDVVMDDSTGALYVATDFGVVKGTSIGGGLWSWTTTSGMPKFEVAHLAMVPGQRDPCRVCAGTGIKVLYAATHSDGIWLMRLS